MSAASADIMRSLEGSARVILRQPGAKACFDVSERGFWRSFVAMVIAAPIHFWLFLSLRQLLIDRGAATGDTYTPVAFGPDFLIETCTYVASWTLFPILLVFLTRWMNIAEHFAPYIIVRNWTFLLVYLVLDIPPMALYNLGILSLESHTFLALVSAILNIWILWLIAQAALKVNGGQAFALVTIDVFLIFFARALITALILDNPPA